MKPLKMFGVVVAFAIVIAALLAAQGYLSTGQLAASTSAVLSEENNVDEQQETTRLVENKSVYNRYDFDQVEHVYITIFHQQEISENDLTFHELDESYKEFTNLDGGPDLQILFQTGSEQGPSANGFTKGIDKTNATIELRGRSSRLESQKSYKIRLKDSAGLWYGQSVLNLNKHKDDRTRVRNKLAFDYFTQFDDIISLRTNFVELHVKDQTEDPTNDTFESYGLYTHV